MGHRMWTDMAQAEGVNRQGHGHMQQHLRRLQVLQQHLSTHKPVAHELNSVPCKARDSNAQQAEASEAHAHSDTKVATASQAVALIPDSAVITVRRSRPVLLGYRYRTSFQACMCMCVCKLVTCVKRCKALHVFDTGLCSTLTLAPIAGCRICWLRLSRVLSQGRPPSL